GVGAVPGDPRSKSAHPRRRLGGGLRRYSRGCPVLAPADLGRPGLPCREGAAGYYALCTDHLRAVPRRTRSAADGYDSACEQRTAAVGRSVIPRDRSPRAVFPVPWATYLPARAPPTSPLARRGPAHPAPSNIQKWRVRAADTRHFWRVDERRGCAEALLPRSCRASDELSTGASGDRACRSRLQS